jgi:AraC-like DNA-binding protein
MPLLPPDYFRYFLPSRDLEVWGLGVTAAGFTHVKPGSDYPPGHHPTDHDFSWEHGRILEALQIVLIVSGRGTFEMRGFGAKALVADSAFAILPRTWHRYRPELATGWVESWVEVQGPVITELLRTGVFASETVVRAGATTAGLDAAMEALHAIARDAGAGFNPELSACALAVVAAWRRIGLIEEDQPPARRAVAAAERYLSEHFSEPVNVQALSAKVGMAYSHFRREFQQRTGFAPWRYVLHLRLSRARRMLVASQSTLDDIAARLGFSSAFHFSAAFKRAYGISPHHWRKEMRPPAPTGETAGGRR